MIRKLLAVTAIVVAVLGLSTVSAFAHAGLDVTGPAGTNGLAPATLEVPNERSDSGTMTIALVFPEAPPIPNAEASPVAGWTSTVTKTGGRVDRITWTGGPLTGENSVELPILLGPVPTGTTEMTFAVLQTYQDGQVVRWIDPTQPGGEEPDHPAPVATFSAASAVGQTAPPSTTATSSTTAPAQETSSEAAADESDSSDSTALIVGLVVAVVVLAIIVFIVVRQRRSGKATDNS